MAGQAESLNQAKHELERQRFKLQKELVGFEALHQELQIMDARARQGDAVAIRQFQALEQVANGDIGKQMQLLLEQLDQLHNKYSRLVKIKGNLGKGQPAESKKEVDAFEVKIKKKRRTRIKYL